MQGSREAGGGAVSIEARTASRASAAADGDRSMTDYEHVPCPVCQGRGRIPLEEAAKIAGVSLEEARRAAREAEKQKADDLEQRIAEAAARRGSLEGT